MKEGKLGWKNTTLGEYLKIEKVLENKLDTLDKTLDILNILTGEDYSVVPVDTYLKKVAELSYLNSDVETIDLPKEIVLNGRKYTLKQKADDITAAQFIDYSNYIKEDTDDKIIKIVGTFMIPSGHKYGDGYDFDVVMKDASDMPLPIANSLSFFLRKQSKTLLRHSLYSLTYQIVMNKKVSLKKRMKAIGALATVYRHLESYRIF